MIAAGSARAQGLKAKPVNRVRAIQSNWSEGRSDTKGGQRLTHPEPHRGNPTYSSFISESRLGGFASRPSVWVGTEVSRFSRQGLLEKDV
jgi:hypothetical protein